MGKNLTALWSLFISLAFASTPVGATVLEDPDEGEVGDFFKYLARPGDEEFSVEGEEAAAWVAKVRAERGLTAPLEAVTAGEARAELEEPPLAPDEVRFVVDEEAGWIE
ncbi:MAG: hypothetical protein V3T41_00575, partial [bacterium]